MRKDKDLRHEGQDEAFHELDDFIRRSRRAGKIEDRRLRKLVKAIHDSDSNGFSDDFYDDDLEYLKKGKKNQWHE